MVASRSDPKATVAEVAHGIPMFFDQLIETLRVEQTSQPPRGSAILDEVRGATPSPIGELARLHGRDLHEQGFTLEQVVRNYGDVCQAVTKLAFELNAPIEVHEFRIFNRCLDTAIAGAVTEYAIRQRTVAAEDDFQAFNARLGPLAHELRNYLHTATLAVTAIRGGSVGIAGATGMVLDRSLNGMRQLIDRSMAEVRVAAGMPPRPIPIRLVDLLGQIEAAASLDSRARGCHFTVATVDPSLMIYADPEMIASALGNLLHNAFKFTKPQTGVRLRAYQVSARILIDVEDHCGGLPTGAADTLLQPFTQVGGDRSGLGLGLDIGRRAVEANNGDLKVRDVPGSGCVFTIDLPRHVLGS